MLMILNCSSYVFISDTVVELQSLCTLLSIQTYNIDNYYIMIFMIVI
jgi:hypothetical protein